MKRLLISFSIVIASFLLFVVGMGVILALAPGSRIFGVSYVSAIVGKNQVIKEWNDYIEGDIQINAEKVPVIIEVLPYTQTKVTFTQLYSGYTTNESRVPDAEIERTADGISVKTHEISRFLIGSNREFSLVVQIPLEWARSGRHSISVYAENSDVTLTVKDSAADVELNFDNLVFNGNGKLSVDCAVKANNLDLTTTNDFELGEKLSANNVKFKTTSANLTIKKAIEGDIEFSSTRGNLKFVSALNVKAQTTSGSILPFEETNLILNSCEISTRSGKISVSEVLGVNQSSVSTNSGKITLKNVNNAKISSPRGKIEIETIKLGEINGGTREISVKNVLTSLEVNSKQGDVNIGTSAGACVVKSVKVNSTSGEISVYNPTGEVNLTSTNANILLMNNSATKIDVSCGKNLVAHGLSGLVNVYAKKNITLSIARLDADVNITGGQDSREINVSAQEKAENVNYSLTLTKKGSAKVFAGQEQVGASSAPESAKKINISAQKCDINLYLGK